MRAPNEPSWFEHQTLVPLTGREPILVRLRTYLRRGTPSGDWVLVYGPAGSGRTRVLDEVQALLAAEGAPVPLRVRPLPEGGRPLEAIRVALLERIGPGALSEHARALGTLLGAEGPQTLALAAWLAGHLARPEAASVTALLCALSGKAPLLVDDLDGLDLETLHALRDGPTVVATGDRALPWIAEHARWELEPLGETQVELLLRRWLKHPATARRLAQDLHGVTRGWPGRLVRAVRALGRAGILVRRARGVVHEPGREVRLPDAQAPRDPDGELRQVAECKGTPWMRVLDVASVAPGSDDADLLADASRVKRTVVRALLAEASAGRGGVLPGTVFSSAERRKAHAATLSGDQRELACGARVAAALRRVAARPEQASAALDLAGALLAAGRPGEALAAVEPYLDGAHLHAMGEAWMVETLEQVALWQSPPIMGRELVLCARVARCLRALGAAAAAVRVMDLVGTPIPLPLTAALAHAEQASSSDRVRSANEALAVAVATDGCWATAAEKCQARLRLARFALETARYPEAREQLAALAFLARHPARDEHATNLSLRRKWHELSAYLAQVRLRWAAACAHAQRAANLATLAGDVRSAAASLSCAGQALMARNQSHRALYVLARAAELHAIVRDAEQEIMARLSLGILQAQFAAYDEAAQTLEQALVVAHRSRFEGLRARIHLALTEVHHERGDLGAERRHAARAAECASTAEERTRAAALLAEADLRAGFMGADGLLERAERDLRSLGLDDAALAARATLFDSRMGLRDLGSARAALLGASLHAPLRLRAARLQLSEGKAVTAVPELRILAEDVALPPSLRAEAYVRLAEACEQLGRLPEAQRSAICASSMLQVRRRSRAHDARLHTQLARIFRRVGESGRAAGHRSAARSSLRRLAGAVGNGSERRRIARRELAADPRPRLSLVAS